MGRQAATGAISLNRFWNATVSFAVSVEIRLSADLSEIWRPSRADDPGISAEDIVSAGFYLPVTRVAAGGKDRK